MKVLWMVNVKLPAVYRAKGEDNKSYVAGWLNQVSERFLNRSDLELVVCYPSITHNYEYGESGNLKYYGLIFNDKKLRNGNLLEDDYVPALEIILKNELPDVIHIHGTEFQYAYFMTVAAQNLDMIDKVAISIQGMVSFYAKHYLFGIPWSVKHGKTLKEFIQNSSTYAGYKSYLRRGIYEYKAIQNARFVIGRTNWDRGCTYLVSPKAEYLFCNETLRENFYTDNWDYSKCRPYSIFVSQASYPIKGFHLFLEALKVVKKLHPNVSVRVAGANLLKDNFVKGSTYALYLQHLIRKHDLYQNIEFIGNQTAEQMKKEMLSANVFVSSSIIENSPNSLGEGMVLGVPCISSDVGGVAELMIHNYEGYIYPLNETYMLAYYIIDVFNNPDKATLMGQNARKHALITHNADTNFKALMEIYLRITGKEEMN
ncbi:glycosyltransferase family 4 protein [Youngiibacter multivorans]|uniref:Glycosyltransferase involved in cell wall biosynthesis n=1 Tax=Youngiibacter multivorans TaxID=937251 RepID=A0ABS4G6E6_9CLOT|nr:glycosyltransferase [Youngiibacter multivorans]MBP1920096.1 glycosyltransferase involved in cell wall biosynthesis [Youngiibacter multivorans]